MEKIETNITFSRYENSDQSELDVSLISRLRLRNSGEFKKRRRTINIREERND